jgi:hypothetical protein
MVITSKPTRHEGAFRQLLWLLIDSYIVRFVLFLLLLWLMTYVVELNLEQLFGSRAGP